MTLKFSLTIETEEYIETYVPKPSPRCRPSYEYSRLYLVVVFIMFVVIILSSFYVKSEVKIKTHRF